MRVRFAALALAAAAVLAPTAQAAPITTLFNTGVDASGNVLPDGTLGDLHYSLVSVPSGTTQLRIRTSAGGYPIPPYFGDDTTSRWIGPNNTPQVDGPVGAFVFRTTFDLTGFDHTTASIAGGWSTDNNGLDIRINGVSLGYTTSFTQFTTGFSAFAVTSGFVSGVNTLDFHVNNGGGPTALRVEMAGTADPAAAVPEPGTLALLGAGIAAIGARRRRRQTD